MKLETRQCRDCEKLYKVINSGIKGSNGAFIRHYKINGFKIVGRLCHPCKIKFVRSRLKENRESCNKYEKTINGFLMRVYRNMKSRVAGVTKNKNHLYLGLEILDKKEFYEWSKLDKSFNRLFRKWEKSGYERVITPSIDRIDSSKGYSLGNVQWITFSENCKRGASSKIKRL